MVGWDTMGQSGAGDKNFRPLGDFSDTTGREFGEKWENMGRHGKNSVPFFPRGHRIPLRRFAFLRSLYSIPRAVAELRQPNAIALSIPFGARPEPGFIPVAIGVCKSVKALPSNSNPI